MNSSVTVVISSGYLGVCKREQKVDLLKYIQNVFEDLCIRFGMGFVLIMARYFIYNPRK